jgi:ATP-dependent 26S proteasome regulatory subunit
VQVEKAPLESYADVGGLEQQIQEIKEVGRRGVSVQIRYNQPWDSCRIW